MRVADYIASRLAFLGVRDAFSVTGGAAMHLNDAFGENTDIAVHYMHNEQACSIAAEGYARLHWNPACVVVTAGPGAINAMNGVFGAFTDSIPMVIVSGQVRLDTLVNSHDDPNLRQLGDQELQTVEVVKSFTKYVCQMRSALDAVRIVDEAWLAAVSGRPGPAWIDVPVNVQNEQVEADPRGPLMSREEAAPLVEESALDVILDMLTNAQRPLILAGTGIRAAGVVDDLVRFAEVTSVPVCTAWTHDTVDSEHPLFAGRPGTIGTRPGNFAVQSCDVLLVLGSRLNIRQVSYNWIEFAPHAQIIHVDLDPSELAKPHLKTDMKVVGDLRAVMPKLVQLAESRGQGSAVHEQWVQWCASLRQAYEPKRADYPTREAGINAYHFFMEMDGLLTSRHVVASGDATACIVPFQVLSVKPGMRLFSNSGSASMGYDLAAALGASVAAPDRSVVCLAGDGSIMMNIQELQTLAAWNADVTVFILDNNGYLSIKQTQSNFFGRSHGSAPDSGVTFPDFAAVSRAFGLTTIELTQGQDWAEALRACLAGRGPQVCVVHLDQEQEFEPRLKSKMTPAGIRTPSLDDMFPHLPEELLASIRGGALSIV